MYCKANIKNGKHPLDYRKWIIEHWRKGNWAMRIWLPDPNGKSLWMQEKVGISSCVCVVPVILPSVHLSFASQYLELCLPLSCVCVDLPSFQYSLITALHTNRLTTLSPWTITFWEARHEKNVALCLLKLKVMLTLFFFSFKENYILVLL